MLVTYETSFTMRGVTGVIVQRHQTLPLPQKSPSKSQRNLPKTAETWFTISGRSENDPTMIREWTCQSATRPAAQLRLLFTLGASIFYSNTTFRAPASIPNFIKYCACHEKWPLNLTKYCACQGKISHDWSLSHMKRHLYCAEQQASSSNVTKYCPCHEKWLQNLREICRKQLKGDLPIREWSEHEPRMAQEWANFGSRDVEKLHAAVARSAFSIPNVQSTPCSDQFWKLGCREMARRCGAKPICKPKCTKHTMFGPLLEIRIRKNLTLLWREARFQVKMLRLCRFRPLFEVRVPKNVDT